MVRFIATSYITTLHPININFLSVLRFMRGLVSISHHILQALKTLFSFVADGHRSLSKPCATNFTSNPPLHPSSARSGNTSVAITATPVTRNSPA